MQSLHITPIHFLNLCYCVLQYIRMINRVPLLHEDCSNVLCGTQYFCLVTSRQTASATCCITLFKVSGFTILYSLLTYTHWLWLWQGALCLCSILSVIKLIVTFSLSVYALMYAPHKSYLLLHVYIWNFKM